MFKKQTISLQINDMQNMTFPASNPLPGVDASHDHTYSLAVCGPERAYPFIQLGDMPIKSAAL